MSYGMAMLNSSNQVDGISSEANTVVFIKKLSSTSSNNYDQDLGKNSGLQVNLKAKMAKYTFTCPNEPIVFVRQVTIDDTNVQPTRVLGVEKGSGDTYHLWVSYPYDHNSNSNYNEYYIFAQMNNSQASSDSHGMRMYDSGGNLTFDSGKKPLIFKGSCSIPGLTVGQSGQATYNGGTYSKPAYLARTVSATDTSWWYGYQQFWGYNVYNAVQSRHPYIWMKENNKLHIQWYVSAHIQSYYHYDSDFTTALNSAINVMKDDNCINMTHTQTNWTNISFGGAWIPLIDGADYD